MRISSNTLFENSVSQLGTLQGNLAKTQMQLASNRRMLTAADDPIAASRALEITQSQAVNSQFAVNRQNARASLSEVELTLGGVTSLIQDVQTLAMSAGNGVLKPSDLSTIATELSGRLDDLLGLANSADTSGGYMFGGFRTTTPPFSKTASGADYNGDQGQRKLQVGLSREVPISDSGNSIFQSNVTGNGIFALSAGPGNTGAGLVGAGVVTDRQALLNRNYEITFRVTGTPAVTSYNVIDTTTGAAPAGFVGPAQFASGQQIKFDGISFDIKGNPANGDSFTVAPSKRQSLFETVSNLITALRAPAGGTGGGAALSNELTKARENLGSALDNVLGKRAAVGTSLKELDNLDSLGEDLNVQYATTLSGLQDLDTAATISLFTQQQFMLEAAQKSFKSMSSLSLFNYIS